MESIERITRSLYIPPKKSRKGMNGKLLIVGGSRQYHGAPMLSIIAARRFVDLVSFYPPDRDILLIRAVKTIPEVIVKRSAPKPEEYDCVLFGVGLGKARYPLGALAKAKRAVIDADGLRRVKGKIPKGCILTPHEGEFKMLFGKEGTKKNVKEMAKKHSCIILKKGHVDIISDGKRTLLNKVHNEGMTRGGTGDVLSGLVAALFCKNPAFESAAAAAYLNGVAGNLAKKEHGLNFCASDVADNLSIALRKAKA
ncbi:MAG: NAD(P)H-hydrate dehydratase [Candidatus Micrarchaeota archaeon]